MNLFAPGRTLVSSENRPLDLAWIEDFVALAESGGFSRAADARAIAQPALSRHIRSLEEWVGADLVDRSAHPVELTEAGRRLLPLVREVLASLEAARIKARLAQGDAAASLRFAVTHSLSITFFPRWLGALETRLRHGPVQTFADHSRACEDHMAQRRVQFVLCHGHPEVPGRLDDGRYPVTILGDDALVPVCAPAFDGSPQHDLDGGDAVATLDYSDASGLGRILRSRLRDRLAAAGSGEQQRISAVFTAHNAFLLKTMALAGRGAAWLPASLVADELRRKELVPAGRESAWRVPVDIRLYRQHATMAPAAEELWRLSSG